MEEQFCKKKLNYNHAHFPKFKFEFSLVLLHLYATPKILNKHFYISN